MFSISFSFGNDSDKYQSRNLNHLRQIEHLEQSTNSINTNYTFNSSTNLNDFIESLDKHVNSVVSELGSLNNITKNMDYIIPAKENFKSTPTTTISTVTSTYTPFNSIHNEKTDWDCPECEIGKKRKLEQQDYRLCKRHRVEPLT